MGVLSAREDLGKVGLQYRGVSLRLGDSTGSVQNFRKHDAWRYPEASLRLGPHKVFKTTSSGSTSEPVVLIKSASLTLGLALGYLSSGYSGAG